MSKNYNSVLVTLKDLVEGNQELNLEKNIKFNIPIYQRLYVWKEDQVKRLLEDTFNTCLEDESKDYFLGGVIVVKNGERYDLIDGQQRFITLLLIAIFIRSSLEPFLEDRIHFSIREYANKLFDNFFEDKKTDHLIKERADEYLSNPSLNGNSELSNINNAYITIKNFFMSKDRNNNKEKFSRYLYENLKLVFTTVPQDVDLNKLFETINSGGVQLQHHELLKAKMLENITSEKEQKIYSKLWDTCAFMDNYIENNLATAMNIKKTYLFTTLYKNDIDNLRNPDTIVTFINNELGDISKSDKKSLKEILESDLVANEYDNIDDNEDEIKVRSIISFSMLLLHTLRMFFKQNGSYDIKEVKEKDLLTIFTAKDKDKYGIFEFSEENVKSFIKLLWKVRFSFDENIIKWVSVENGADERHIICKIYPNKSSNSPSLQRIEQEESKSFSLLQSMLYHTQPIINHYWLTPLLYKLIENTSSNEEYLQKLDNYLFFPKKDGDLRTDTWNSLGNYNLPHDNNCKNILNQFNLNNGETYTQFSHYLFYKIEYILWQLGYKIDDKEIKQDSDFYFRAKNSVEHINPQTQDSDKIQNMDWTGELLHTFGNLSLVSRERNSEFGNLTFEEKKVRFWKLTDNSQHLKMSLIYANTEWGNVKCQEHLQYIEEKVVEYMNCEK